MSDNVASLSEGLSVAAHVSMPLEVALRVAIAQPHTLIVTHAWADLTTLIRQQHIDIVFVDPHVDSPPATTIIAQLMDVFPSVAFVVYAMLRHDTVRVVHELTKHGLHHVLLYQYDDGAARIALLLDELPARYLFAAVLACFKKELTRAPQRLQEQVEQVFASPMLTRSVEELAAQAGMSRPHLYEIFQEVGLGSPGRMLVGTRLLRAYLYLRDSGHSFNQVAAKTGWSDPRALRRYLTSVFGMPVNTLRRSGDTAELTKRIVRWMRTGRLYVVVSDAPKRKYQRAR